MVKATDIAIMRMVTDVIIAQISQNKVDTEALPGLTRELFVTLKSVTETTHDDESIDDNYLADIIMGKHSVEGMYSKAMNTLSDKRDNIEQDVSSREKDKEADAHFAQPETGNSVHSVREEKQDERMSEDENRIPAVPIEDSVLPDQIICLEDGVAKKMLKRYLKTSFNMTPEEYKAKWGLPEDYPMVAPNHSKRRSEIAYTKGFGKANKGKVRKRI